MSQHPIMVNFHSQDHPISIPFDGSLYEALQICIKHYKFTNLGQFMTDIHQKNNFTYPLSNPKKISEFLSLVLSKHRTTTRFNEYFYNNLSDCALVFNIRIILITSSKLKTFGLAHNETIYLLLNDQSKFSMLYPARIFDINYFLNSDQSVSTTSKYVFNCGYQIDSQYLNLNSVYEVYLQLQKIICHPDCKISKFDKSFILNFRKRLMVGLCICCSRKAEKSNNLRCKRCDCLFCKNKDCYVDSCAKNYGKVSCFICNNEIMKIENMQNVENKSKRYQINITECPECDKMQTLVNFCDSCGNLNVNEDLMPYSLCIKCGFYLADTNGCCDICSTLDS